MLSICNIYWFIAQFTNTFTNKEIVDFISLNHDIIMHAAGNVEETLNY